MKQKNLVIFSGIPGAGKTYWARNHLREGDAYVSRDEIRFSIVDEDEDYFSHEAEVFTKFVARIEEELASGKRVFADATHINWASRRKLLERIHDKENIDIDVYVFKTPMEICLARNAQREGRAVVSDTVIKRMRGQMTHPLSDPFKYHMMKNIYPDGGEEDIRYGGMGNK